MIGIGVIRADLALAQETRDRFQRVIQKTAALEGADLTKIVIYNADTVDLLLAVLADAGSGVMVYTPFRTHVHGIETAILQRAALVCVLDDGTSVDLGPIRPEHAVAGWRLDNDGTGWGLSRWVEGHRAQIRPTTSATVSWTVYGPGGDVLREASAHDVDDAKSAADQWLRGEKS